MPVQYNCEQFDCEPDMVERMQAIVEQAPSNVYFAPYPKMDAKIALTACFGASGCGPARVLACRLESWTLSAPRHIQPATCLISLLPNPSHFAEVLRIPALPDE